MKIAIPTTIVTAPGTGGINLAHNLRIIAMTVPEINGNSLNLWVLFSTKIHRSYFDSILCDASLLSFNFFSN